MTLDVEDYLYELCETLGVPSAWPTKYKAFCAVDSCFSSWSSIRAMRKFVKQHPQATPAELFEQVKRYGSYLPFWAYDKLHPQQPQIPANVEFAADRPISFSVTSIATTDPGHSSDEEFDEQWELLPQLRHRHVTH